MKMKEKNLSKSWMKEEENNETEEDVPVSGSKSRWKVPSKGGNQLKLFSSHIRQEFDDRRRAVSAGR